MMNRSLNWLVGMSVVIAGVLCHAAPPVDPTAWNLKTAAPETQKFKPFLDAMGNLRSDLDKSDNLPADADSRLNQVKGMAATFHQHSRAFVSTLKQNNETAAFDALITARLVKGGHPVTASEIQKAGGATAVLANGERAIEEEMAGLSDRIRKTLPEKAAQMILGSLLDLIETRRAEAGLYGGGVKGTCSYWLIVYYLSLGIDPTFCLYS